MAKYAPANADGEKPYVVETWNFGATQSKVVYAKDAVTAKYRVIGRQRFVHAQRVRRALADEVTT